MPDVQLLLPRLHPGQAQVAREARRFNVLTCGRRWGKSLFVLDRLCDTPGKGILDGCPTAWFTATSKIADAVWRLAKQTLEPITATKDEQHRRIECITGGSLDVWSLESTGVALGRKYGVAAVDEAAVARNLKERWLQEIRPTLTDLQGHAWFPSTPRGKQSFYYELWARGQRPAGSWKSWLMPTSTNPHIPADEIEEARQEYAEIERLDLFKQEYLAEFITGQGAVFFPDKVKRGKLPKFDYLYIGVDVALTAEELDRGDESAFAVIGIDAEGRWWLVDLVHGRWSPDACSEHLWAVMERHNPQIVWIEGGPAGLGLEPWVRRRMDDAHRWWSVQMMSHLREKLAKNASAAALCNSGRLWVPEDAAWWPDMAEQLSQFTGAQGGKDDLVDAFGIAVRGAQSVMGTALPRTEAPPPAERSRQWFQEREAARRPAAQDGPRTMWRR